MRIEPIKFLASLYHAVSRLAPDIFLRSYPVAVPGSRFIFKLRMILKVLVIEDLFANGSVHTIITVVEKWLQQVFPFVIRIPQLLFLVLVLGCMAVHSD